MTTTGYPVLELNSIPLRTYGYWHLDFTPLLEDEVRGDDLTIPLVAGRTAYPRRRTALEVSLPVVIRGAVDKDNTPYSDRHKGAIANLIYLKANIGIGSTSGDGTVSAVIRFRDNSTMSTTAHVLGFTSIAWRNGSHDVLNTTLDLSIPSGTWGAITGP